jgi:co-chaperonin GroES (HSP10)
MSVIVTPLKNRVLVAENAAETKTTSGLILQGTSASDSKTATVLEVGSDVTLVAKGDKIMLDWSKGAVVKLDGVQRVLIEEDHVVAKLS